MRNPVFPASIATGSAIRSLAALAVLAAVFAAPGCSVDKRSELFACVDVNDCTDPGRLCIDGYCVVPECPVECDSCLADNTCVIECVDTGSCSGPIVCPPGIGCEVRCTGDSSCGGGVDCAATGDCAIQCEGITSCGGVLQCGDGSCLIECTGQSSCNAVIDCSGSCACDTDCSGINACQQGSTCPGAGNCEQGGECRSNVGGCNAC